MMPLPYNGVNNLSYGNNSHNLAENIMDGLSTIQADKDEVMQQIKNI